MYKGEVLHGINSTTRSEGIQRMPPNLLPVVCSAILLIEGSRNCCSQTRERPALPRPSIFRLGTWVPSSCAPSINRPFTITAVSVEEERRPKTEDRGPRTEENARNLIFTCRRGGDNFTSHSFCNQGVDLIGSSWPGVHCNTPLIAMTRNAHISSSVS